MEKWSFRFAHKIRASCGLAPVLRTTYGSLHTGTRINELCQIYLDDIKQVDGIWCLLIRNKRADQSLETQSSERIPMQGVHKVNSADGKNFAAE